MLLSGGCCSIIYRGLCVIVNKGLWVCAAAYRGDTELIMGHLSICRGYTVSTTAGRRLCYR